MNNLNLYSETVSGYTAVSDLFIDEYVPSANGDFVKVYLYLLRLLTRKNSSLSISSLADTFNQTENDVMRALMAKSIETTFDDTSEAASSAEVSSAKAVAGTVVSAVSLLNSGVA